jgi:D-alanine-D-alanine ligase
MARLKVGWFFGGRSAEHEVSVITALQAYENLNKEKYEVIPIYVSKSEDFYTNPKFLDLKNYKNIDSLLLSSSKITLGKKDGKGGFFTQGILNKFTPFDVAFLGFHGSFGEDGAIQGLFEIYQIPYTGLGVWGSAVGMEKVASKALFKSLGLPVGNYLEVKRIDWLKNSKDVLRQTQKDLKFPMFVKPGNGGSSIGVNKAKDEDSLNFCLEVAFTYSDKAIVEQAFEGLIEVNCSALGYEEIKASVCEMPIATKDVLSFEDKYQRGGGKGSKGAGMASLTRVIPAPISASLTKKIQESTIKIFKALDGCGVIRVDYFVDKKYDRFWVNELNSIPGSFSFYLWEKSDIKYFELLDMLIEFALKRSENQKKTQYTFNTSLLSDMASGRTGGSKS